jgi:single-strand DNA-binding protein
MASYNKVLLVGNLTRDPQLSVLPSQTSVVDFGLAVNRRWRGQDGQQKEEVCFVDCTAFGKTGEAINTYMRKGRQILVEGRLHQDTWQAQDGTKRSKHKVVVENFQFLDSGQRQGAPAGAPGGAPAGEEGDYPPQGQPPPRRTYQAPPRPGPAPVAPRPAQEQPPPPQDEPPPPAADYDQEMTGSNIPF